MLISQVLDPVWQDGLGDVIFVGDEDPGNPCVVGLKCIDCQFIDSKDDQQKRHCQTHNETGKVNGRIDFAACKETKRLPDICGQDNGHQENIWQKLNRFMNNS
jgi:hypothetical protein